METIDKVINLVESPLVDWVIKGILIYLAILWLAIVIWVARDIINRSNSIIFQVFVILINILLPVFGLILYLIIRPSKTLVEKYYEEMEYSFLSEHSEHEDHCRRCEKAIQPEFIYCPNCQEKVRSQCTHCKHTYLSKYRVCPYCGKKAEQVKSDKKKSKKAKHKKEAHKEEKKKS